MRRILWGMALVGLLLLPACSDTPDVSDELNIDRSGFNANFNPAEAIIPFPSNLLFNGSADGTLNIPVDDTTDFSDPQVALNALDGFSTVAPISTTFSSSINATSLTADTVHLFEINITQQGAVTGVVRPLVYGQEYLATLSSVDDSGTTLVIVPLKPLNPSSSYLVGLTRGIKNTAGLSASPDFVYVLTKSPNPLIDSEGHNLVPALTVLNPDGTVDQAASDATAQLLEGLRQLVQTHEAALAGEDVNPSDVVLSWTFNTQSVGVVLGKTRDNATGFSGVSPMSIGTTAELLGAGPGIADVFAGTLTIPYYLTNADTLDANGLPTDPLTKFWTGAGGTHLTSLDPDGLLIPGGTATPVSTSSEIVPLLVSVPNASSGNSKPVSGWKTVIFQHGITSDRTAMLAAADSLAAAGFAVVAIDLPLHGLKPPEPGDPPSLYTDFERTFDLDLVNNTTGAPLDFAGGEMPDGADSSGTHFINLSSLLTTRDNLRQAVADLFALTAALETMDINGDIDTTDFDTSNIYFVGHSFGAMVGSVFLALEPDVKDATLGMAGGGIAKLLDGSASFGPRIAAGLAAKGVIKGSVNYESFLGAAQTVIDSGDPINYASDAVAGRGVLMFEVIGDLVVPNNVMINAPEGTVPSPLAGTDPLAFYMGLEAVSATTSGSALLRFVSGDHSSILDPTADSAVTTVMQNAMATFLATDGETVSVLDDTVLE